MSDARHSNIKEKYLGRKTVSNYYQGNASFFTSLLEKFVSLNEPIFFVSIYKVHLFLFQVDFTFYMEIFNVLHFKNL